MLKLNVSNEINKVEYEKETDSYFSKEDPPPSPKNFKI